MDKAQQEAAKQTILVVEDDARTARIVATYLENAGFAVQTAANGHEGLRCFAEVSPALVILDLMLPEMDGWAVCGEIRKTSRTPVLILSARDREGDRIRGLELGADDYVVKPFSPKEVVARVKAILRRAPQDVKATGDVMQSGELSLDTAAKLATLAGDALDLTRSEFLLLRTFMSHPGQTFSRAELLSVLYPEGEAVVERVVDVHVGELRAKIESDRADPKFVKTVRGFGYRFAAGEAPS